MKKVMKKLCVCTLSAVIGMLSIQIMPVSAASKTGMGKITNKINKAGYNLWGGYDSPEEAATYDIDFYDSGINAGVAVGGNISLKYNDSYDYGDNLKYNWQIVNGNDHIAMEVSADQKTARITGRSIGDATVRLNIITDEGTEYQSIENRKAIFDKNGDTHYDNISAFIKSMRGSDPDAVLFYLARALNGGEDPVFLARRIVICASEDVGLADPQALVIATSAMQAVHMVGMPEARII